TLHSHTPSLTTLFRSERLGDLRVRLDREEQRDVDVHALVDRLLDRRHALVRPRDLDHRVGPVEELPIHPRLLEGPLGVAREPWRDRKSTRLNSSHQIS